MIVRIRFYFATAQGRMWPTLKLGYLPTSRCSSIGAFCSALGSRVEQNMGLPAYDIFKRKNGHLVWVDVVQDIESAKRRIKELSRNEEKPEFVVFSQRTQQVVAVLHDTSSTA